MLSAVLVRLRALVLRRRVEADLDEELRYHVDRETERNVAKGMSLRDARDAARRAFGNPTVAAEQAREAWRWRWIEEVRQDVAFAFRTFRRAPLFVVTVVGTIGLALGLETTAFTIFNAYVLRPLSVRDPHSLYALKWRDRSAKTQRVSWAQFQALRQQRDVFASLAAERFVFARLGPLPGYGNLVSGNYFTMLGVQAAIGRTLLPSDDGAPGSASSLVLSHRTWRVHFGGDTAIVGRTFQVRGYPMRVVGVAREDFGGLTDTPLDFWAPLSMIQQLEGIDLSDPKQPPIITLVGHLAPGVSDAQARGRLGAWVRANAPPGPRSALLVDAELESRATPIVMRPELLLQLSPIVATFVLVMLIACANIANMMLARSLARQREIGIRLALGAARRRLIRQLLTEALVLAVPAALVGFMLARLALDLAIRAMFATVPPVFTPYLRVVPLSPDLRVAAFTALAGLASALFFGLAPAVTATRPSVVEAARGNFDAEDRPSRLRNTLLVAQVTACVLLLICTGILIGGARALRRTDVGFNARDVLAVTLQRTPHSAILDVLRDGGRGTVAAVSSPPLNGYLPATANLSDGQRVVRTSVERVSSSYFTLLEIPIVRGRSFTADESRTSAPVAVISEGTARQFWPDGNAIGQMLAISRGDETTKPDPLDRYRRARVIGVARDAVVGFVGQMEPAMAYYPAPIDSATSYIVKTSGDVNAARRRIGDALNAADPNALDEMHTLDEALAVQVYPFLAAYWVASALGGIALALTLTGIYGVLSYVVAQRTKEIGIRVALGASAVSIVLVVTRQTLRYAAAGIILGTLLALGVSAGIAATFLSVSRAFDPMSYGGAIGLVLASCAAAAYVPSRKAARVNPVEALRAGS